MSISHSQAPLLLMGVSGSGKTVIGRLLADRLGMPFLDADDLHPPENVERMRRGIQVVFGRQHHGDPFVQMGGALRGNTALKFRTR
jgi:shikimate kinase